MIFPFFDPSKMVSFYTFFDFFTLCQNFASKFVCLVRSLWDLCQSGIFLNPRHIPDFKTVLKLQMTITLKRKNLIKHATLVSYGPWKNRFKCVSSSQFEPYLFFLIALWMHETLDIRKHFGLFLSQSFKGFDNLGNDFILGTQAHLVVVFFKISPMV